jgi:hypothetical protein
VEDFLNHLESVGKEKPFLGFLGHQEGREGGF